MQQASGRKCKDAKMKFFSLVTDTERASAEMACFSLNLLNHATLLLVVMWFYEGKQIYKSGDVGQPCGGQTEENHFGKL